jgi:hypothetical protein
LSKIFEVFRERHTLHMGAYGYLDTNCPAPLFLWRNKYARKKKKVRIYHELGLLMGALGKMINNISAYLWTSVST